MQYRNEEVLLSCNENVNKSWGFFILFYVLLCMLWTEFLNTLYSFKRAEDENEMIILTWLFCCNTIWKPLILVAFIISS